MLPKFVTGDPDPLVQSVNNSRIFDLASLQAPLVKRVAKDKSFSCRNICTVRREDDVALSALRLW